MVDNGSNSAGEYPKVKFPPPARDLYQSENAALFLLNQTATCDDRIVANDQEHLVILRKIDKMVIEIN